MIFTPSPWKSEEKPKGKDIDMLITPGISLRPREHSSRVGVSLRN